MYYNKESFSMYYEKYGHSRNKIIILPGWGNTRKTFNNMINHLKKNNEIYIMDYPGFGKSIFPDKDLTIYDYANLIRSFIKDNDINNPTLIAHSFGGRITTLISGYYKDKVDKLVLIDTAGIKHKKKLVIIKQIVYKTLKKLISILPKRKRSLYYKRLNNLFASVDYKGLNSYMKKTFRNIINEDLKYYIKEINIPTLIIWGKKDKDTPYKDALYMNKNIVNSKLISLENTTHYSYLEKEIKVIEEINNFIKQKEKMSCQRKSIGTKKALTSYW